MGICPSTRKKQRKYADPLKFIDRAHHKLIFQHLTGSQLLDSSEVSPQWHRSTARSGSLVKKVQLRIEDGERSTRNNIFTLALLSIRDYEHLYVCSQNKRAIIETFAASLVTLEIQTYDVALLDLDLPNLRKLFINGDAIAHGILSSAKNLEELHVESIRIPAIKTLKECLKRNVGLKRLSLGASPSSLFNQKNLSNKFGFQLETFCFQTIFIRDTSSLSTFLESQAASLSAVVVRVQYCESFILNGIINVLPNLIALYIHWSDICGTGEPQDLPDGLDLIVNRSLKNLCVEKLFVKNLVRLKHLLHALPNLECLQAMDATNEAFEVIVRNSPKLQEFRTEDRRLMVLKDVW